MLRKFVANLLPLVLLPLSAFADDSPLINQWKTIAGDKSYASSDCIGSNETLECLIDTAVACAAWTNAQNPSGPGDWPNDPICERSELPWLVVGILGYQINWPQEVVIYGADVWRLEDINQWFGGWSPDTKAALGDWVVDIYALSCSPERKCLEQHPFNPSLYCPPVNCSGGHFRPQPTWDDAFVALDQPPRNVLSRAPTSSLLVREEPEGWRVVEVHILQLEPMRGPFWTPDR